MKDDLQARRLAEATWRKCHTSILFISVCAQLSALIRVPILADDLLGGLTVQAIQVLLYLTRRFWDAWHY